MKKQIILFLAFIFLFLSGSATHLIGGTMTYRYVSSTADKVTYVVYVKLYRDCRGGVATTVQFDPSIKVGIYHNNKDKNRYLTEELKLLSKKLISGTGCISTSQCIEEGYYEKKVTFDLSVKGYYLAFTPCCRTIQDNIVTGGSDGPVQGHTLISFIPPTNYINNPPQLNMMFTNNSVNKQYNDFINVTDKDFDQIIYKILAPYKGGSLNNPSEEPALTYNPLPVDYNPGFSFSKPFGNSGNISIDTLSGKLTYTNSATGNYAFCIEIKEYRKGELMGVSRIDYPLVFINMSSEQQKTEDEIKLTHPKFVAGNSISLTWSVCRNQVSNYIVERKEKNGSWDTIKEVTKLNVLDTIPYHKWFYYRVKTTVNATEIISNTDSFYMHPAGISAFSRDIIKIFPNPFLNEVKLEISDAGPVLVKIYNNLGMLLSEELIETKNHTINTSKFPQGVYSIEILNREGKFFRQLMIKK